MDTVYMVTAGTYSDYHIVGAFSSRANACAAISVAGSDDMDIDVYELDPCNAEINQGLLLYYVSMDMTGDDAETSPSTDIRDARFGTRNSTDRYWGYVWAKDEQHAIKIVNEKRTQAIAQGTA